MLSNLLPGDKKKDLDIYNISTYSLICGIITNQFYTKSQCKRQRSYNNDSKSKMQDSRVKRGFFALIQISRIRSSRMSVDSLELLLFDILDG